MSVADQLRLGPTASDVSRLNDWFDHRCTISGIDKTLAADLKLCINEVLANLISYGFGHTAAPWILVKIRLGPRRGSAKVIDNGRYFDLRQWEPPKNRDLATAEPGGFGIALIKERATRIRYYRFCRLNRLEIICEAANP